MKKTRKKRRSRHVQRRVVRPQGSGLSQPQKGRRFTEEEKRHGLALVGKDGMDNESAAGVVGCTVETLRRWTKQTELSGPECTGRGADVGAGTADKTQRTIPPPPSRSPYAPKDPGQGLSGHEISGILEYKKKHPSMGPAQIRAQLKRFKGWRLSVKAISRVLRNHGYEPVHVRGRPQGPEPQRFEAPRRNALWQMDYTELRITGERFHLLVIEDDFSRFVVGHGLASSASTEAAVDILKQAIAYHGRPEAVRTDRGGAFLAKEFTSFLEAELIDHIVGRAYHPQGGGKVESVIGTLKRELWEVEHFHNRMEAERRTQAFFVEYNERRAHMGIDGLCPADRFFGRAEQVLDIIDAVSRKRQGALERACQQPGKSMEENLSLQCGAPLEVLRLVLIDGHMELRFCGTRVILGPTQPS